MAGRLARILDVLIEKLFASPGEVVVETGLPRYEVLAAIHILEELKVIEPLYSRGSHRVYKVRLEEAQALRRALEAEEPLRELARILAGGSQAATTGIEATVTEAVAAEA